MPRILSETEVNAEGRICTGSCGTADANGVINRRFRPLSDFSLNGTYLTGPKIGEPRYQSKCKECTNKGIKAKKEQIDYKPSTRGRKKKASLDPPLQIPQNLVNPLRKSRGKASNSVKPPAKN